MENPIKNNEVKAWAIWSVIIRLQHELGSPNCNNKRNNACDGSNKTNNSRKTTPKQGSPLAVKDANKPAIIYFKPTFIGYCVAIARLSYEAFRYKKRHNFIVIC